MHQEIRLPQMGESVHEGTIARWLKRPGDRIEKFEPLVEIITDKVNVEMPSPQAGVLVELLAAEGETLTVGSPIALVNAAGAEAEGLPAPDEPGAAPALAADARAGAPAMAPAAAPVSLPRPPGGPRLSPLVRRLAEEHAIPLEVLESLPGSGTGGRVTKEDVLRYVADRTAAAAPAVAPSTAGQAAPPIAEPAESGDQIVRLSPVRRAIAQRMAQSTREIPHAYGAVEVEMTAVVAWREAHKDAWRSAGTPLTYTAFFVRAACEALRAFPVVNASWSDEGIVLRRAIHIGIAIAVDEGLVVPVIRDADRLDLGGVTRALEDLTGRARMGRLTLDDVQGGTFTITNAGVFGSAWSVPIIVPGQAAIMATDAIVRRAVVRDDAIAIRPVMHLGLAFDHRIFDGAAAMQFLNHVKVWLEGFRGDS